MRGGGAGEAEGAGGERGGWRRKEKEGGGMSNLTKGIFLFFRMKYTVAQKMNCFRNMLPFTADSLASWRAA